MEKKFTHLHTHSEYSLLDGFSPLDKLLDKTVELGMDSIAITDHGNMFGAIAFYKKAKKRGIKPIFGCEIYVSANDYLIKNNANRELFHLILLAENNDGYKNLMKIISEAYVNGFYYKPRIDKSILRKYSNGIIALSSCLSGEVQTQLVNGNYDEAKKSALDYLDIFGENNFFLELQDHGIMEQQMSNRLALRLSKETGIGTVCTNDLHYVNKEDAYIHDVLLCVQTGKKVTDTDRMKFDGEEFYLKSPEEMYEIFGHLEDTIDNVNKIAERCNVEIEFGNIHLPEFQLPEGKTNVKYLEELTYQGIYKKYKTINDEIKNRVETELEVINKMGFTDYFLIVWDFVKYAKDNDIPVGVGRGSAAGSIVSYALDITGIDPLKYNLLFERFLNSERISMPDIDIDFCIEGRDKIIKYVTEKYGNDRVSQIITFGTMAARGAIRDIGRALDIPYAKVDSIAKLVPEILGITIEKGLEISPEFREAYEKDSETKKLIDIAKSVEGMPRHSSTHAAGILISKDEITNYVPLARNDEIITTQFNMIELEELGLLKMDFLGLRTLTVIKDAVELVKKDFGISVDIDNINPNDEVVIKQFNKGETIGLFQFESQGMRSFLKELKPTTFEDLIAAVSLYRPGPMEEISNYIKNKHFPNQTKFLHEKLIPILENTYGTIVYQEQVMQIVRDIGGFSLGGADLLRRAMGKKKMDVMEKERERFTNGEIDDDGNIVVLGAIRNGVPKVVADEIYDLMIDFANYAFNKAHAVAYSMIAAQTAYLKGKYPVQYMAALISSVLSRSEKVALYINELKKLNIELLPPDINYSFKKFTTDKGHVRFGLLGIKNVGTGFIDALVEAREKHGLFTNFTDFLVKLEKTNKAVINKKAIESLIKAGAFTSIVDHRAYLLSIYEDLLEETHKKTKKNIIGQVSLFEEDTIETQEPVIEIKELDKKILLDMEKEMLGIYITDHPLKPYEQIIKNHTNFNTLITFENENKKIYDKKEVQIGGLIDQKKVFITKKGQQMAILSIEDLHSTIEVIVFPKTYERLKYKLEENNIYIFRGRMQWSDNDDIKILLEDLTDINEFNNKKLYIKLRNRTDKVFQQVKSLLVKYKGNTEVVIYFEEEKKTLVANKSLWIDINSQIYEELKALLGESKVKLF